MSKFSLLSRDPHVISTKSFPPSVNTKLYSLSRQISNSIRWNCTEEVRYFGKTAIEPEDASLCRSSFKIAWPSNSSLEFSSYRQFQSSILVLYRNWLYFDNNNLLSNWRPLDGSSLRSCIVPRSWCGIKDPLSSKERLAVVSEPEFRASIYASSKGRSEESFRLI